MRDRFGQKQYKAPPVVANPSDPNDDQLYHKMPSGEMKPAGKIDDLIGSKNYNIAAPVRVKALHQRNANQWKEAISHASDVASDASQKYDETELTAQRFGEHANQIAQQIAAPEADPKTNETTGLIGFRQPTPAAQEAQAQLASLKAQQQKSTDQQSQLLDSIKPPKQAANGNPAEPGGELWRMKRASALGLAIFKAKANHAAYDDRIQARQLYLKSQGKTDQGDEQLQQIRAAQAPLVQAINGYSPLAANLRASAPTVPTDQPQQIPQPGAEPDNGIPKAPSPDPTLDAEPFALAKNGVKNIR